MIISKESKKSALGLSQSPYKQRSQVGSYCINTKLLAKSVVIDSRELTLKPTNQFFRFFRYRIQKSCSDWLSKSLITSVLIPFSASATYFSNPAQPALQNDGLLKSPPSWYCLRVGYMTDQLYRERFNEEFHIDGTANPSYYAKLKTDAATVTLNFKNWLDINMLIGSAQMLIDRDVFTKRQFAWGVGSKLLIYHNQSIFVGLDLKYFESAQKPVYLVSQAYAYNVISDFKMNFCDEQAALGLGYLNKMICPYLYVSYLYTKIDPKPYFVVIQMPIDDGTAQSYSSSVINKKRWGMALGATILGGAKGSVTLESRFFNQNAINVSGEVRF